MNREDKIKAIEDIKNGMPVQFALNRDRILHQDEGADHFWTSDKQKISIADQKKYLPDAIIFVNVSKQYKYDENGELIEIIK